MTRITFGVKSSPYVACRVLQEIVIDNQEERPIASSIIQNSFYMDDVLTGDDTLKGALQKRAELNQILEASRMPLCKWRSNSKALLQEIPSDLVETSDLRIASSPGEQQKTLGVHWATQLDDLHIVTPSIPSTSSVSKRQLISTLARVFDPLGWFAPGTMALRMMAQKAWKETVSWDEPLSREILLEWKAWVLEMPQLTQHAIHRPFGLDRKDPVLRELHGFSDASEQSYGGVIYLKTQYGQGQTKIDLVLSKGRVAPLKELSVPRLELNGALMLAQLLPKVAEDLKIKPQSIHAWSNSKVVLGWLNHSPASLAQYVSNRVVKIKDLCPHATWRHVPGTDNPADCLSRGLKPHSLCNHSLWWTGPPWLLQTSERWPQVDTGDPVEQPELRKTALAATKATPSLGQGQTSFSHWIRIVAWIRRFWRVYTGKSTGNLTVYLTSLELQEAKDNVFRNSQRVSFPDELDLLQHSQELPKKHPWRKISPFVDRDGILKVGGRLEQSDLPATSIHPIILHGKSHEVRMMAEALHDRLYHPPLSSLMATVAYSFHIPHLRPLLKSIMKNCVACQRKWAHPVR